MTLSVREALRTTALKYGRLLAGEAGLDNRIRWVTVVEILENTDRLAEGEFLITTAYGLSGDEGRRVRFIPSLAARKLAGVAIMTGFYLPEIPPEFVRQADAHKLPLIELPSFLNFSDITRPIMQRIVHSQYELLDYSENIHQELMQIVLSGRSFPGIAELLAARTGGDITVCDAGWQVVARHGARHVSAESREEILVSFQSGDLLNAMRQGEIVCFTSAHNAAPMANVAAPVTAQGKIHGFIVMAKPRREYTELDRVCITHAAMVCALEFLKLKAVEEAELRLQGDFLDEILAGKWLKGSTIAEKGRAMGLDFSRRHNVCIIKLSPPPASAGANNDKGCLYNLYEIARQAFAESRIKIFAKVRRDALVLLLEGEALARKEVVLAAEKIEKRWAASVPNIKIAIGVGENRRAIDQLPGCAEEAELALKFGHFLNPRHRVCFYADLGIFQYLVRLYEQKVDLQAVCDNVLGGLLEYDRKHGKKLLPTLETYLALNQNKQQTAATLFVHRHTLTYRLNRIEKITGMDLHNPNHRILLQLAIYIHRFLSTI
ncbi:MAG: PucR family transcriptional regulator ligand-binding domain-containing protein [Bacillota bacterium]